MRFTDPTALLDSSWRRRSTRRERSGMARAIWRRSVLAESADIVVVDGYTYFPREAVHWSFLEPSEQRSVCGWKGQASYYTIRVNGALNPAAAWEYRDPKPAAAAVKDRIGFWRGVEIQP